MQLSSRIVKRASPIVKLSSSLFKLSSRIMIGVLFLMPAFLPAFLRGAATIRETRQMIKTYPFSDPDPTPIMPRGGFSSGPSTIYPYCAFDGFSKTAVEREWTVIRMENPYIEVFVLPEVGGKVWGAREKSTGREFLYMNHVMKFRQIAMRGPWTSGGLEFNFGVMGHTPTGATPVDYLTRANKDGSVSCVVGALDLPSRTRWNVTITLPPDKAWFETESFWHNPTPLHQSYYMWMNAAVHVSADMQYAFPGNAWIGHDFGVKPAPWPVDGGRDLSWYKNNDFGSYKSYFTLGQYLDFYGVYWNDAKFGLGHWAPPGDVPGRKVWIWGLSREGMIWENLLSDGDGQYSEPQAGRYLNQSDTVFFQPGASDRWREVWFPYKEIGPISAATPCGALSVTTASGVLKLGFCALEEIQDELITTEGGKEIAREKLSLKPLEVWRKEIKTSGQGVMTVKLGKLGDKLSWTSDPAATTLQRPIHFRDYDENTAEGLYAQAERLEQTRKYIAAMEKYQQCLAKEPHHVRALGRVAELYLRRDELGKAQDAARRALDLAMYDPQANFVYGLVARRQGDLTGALEAMGWAARSLEYRSAAWTQMAEIYLMQQSYQRADEYARRALDFNRFDITARQTLAIAARKRGDRDAAQTALKEILAIEPLNHFARSEAWLTAQTPEKLSAFQGAIRGEFPQESYLELASYYVNLKIEDEAIQILRQAPQNSEILYWMSWLLRERGPKESGAFLDLAVAASPKLVFPYRAESIAIFEWVAQQRPEDWKAKYFLALNLWGLGRVDEAQAMLNRCGEPDFAPYYLIQGHAARKKFPERALVFYRKAMEKEHSEWRGWHSAAACLDDLKRTSEALTLAREASALFPEQDTIRLALVKTLMHSSDYAAALDQLNRSAFLPSEGASDVHRLYVECLLRLAIGKIKSGKYEEALPDIASAREYPERLGSGRPYDCDERAQDYLQALCCEKMGKTDEAKKLREAIISFEEKSGKKKPELSRELRMVMEELKN
ncbi:MAG: DUF5107 domain-containing protein [Candidatus Sumerlaeota bacterium]|nr:DUF5107 domain-containing protein [Candidatus Sumerlaeota bacterium]